MIKVALLGDSIRQIGYGKVLPDILGPEYEVWQPKMNGRNAKYTLRELFDNATAMKGTRIVHWNNGHWDLCDLFGDGTFSTEEEYVFNMLRIADILLARYDKVIFATTTPVRPENKYNRNETVCRFNALIVPRLQEKGVIINDLHSLVATDIPRYICEDNIHLSEEGVQLCAQRAAELIRQVAQTLPEENQDNKEYEISAGAPV